MTESGIVFLRPLLLLALLIVPLVLLWPRRIRDARLGILPCLVLALVVLALARPVTGGAIRR